MILCRTIPTAIVVAEQIVPIILTLYRAALATVNNPTTKAPVSSPF